MKPRHKKFMWIALGLAAIGVATALVLTAFNKNLVFFFTPSQVMANEAPLGRTFRDAMGRLNMRIAERADRVILMAAGLPLTMKDRPPRSP